MEEYCLNVRCKRVCNSYEWPAKYRTIINDYRVWRNLLKHMCHDKSKTLILPLRIWVYHDLDLLISEWDWFLSSDRSPLFYQSGETSWKVYPLCQYGQYK